jgi:hypothetical protein
MVLDFVLLTFMWRAITAWHCTHGQRDVKTPVACKPWSLWCIWANYSWRNFVDRRVRLCFVAWRLRKSAAFFDIRMLVRKTMCLVFFLTNPELKQRHATILDHWWKQFFSHLFGKYVHYSFFLSHFCRWFFFRQLTLFYLLDIRLRVIPQTGG